MAQTWDVVTREVVMGWAALRRLVALWLVATGCGGGAGDDAGGGASAPLPDAWADELALATLVDEDPAPDVVHVQLDARVSRVPIGHGRSVEAWTYSGVSPGPVIRARVGDTLRVHFENQLPEATTIHWHGVEVPADQDGAGHAGSEIAAGASFDFEFALKHAGTFWYHPHFNSAEQVWRGLYGALLVEGTNEPPLGEELTLLLRDVELDEATGELGPAAAHGDLGRFFGHEGHTLLVNGRVMPAIAVYPGSTIRLRVINASISRYYRLAVDGHMLWRVAGDSGLLEQSEQKSDVLLVPGERAELVLVVQAAAGTQLLLRALPYDRFVCGGDCVGVQDLMTIRVVAGKGRTETIPSRLGHVDPIDLSAATPRELTLADATQEGDRTRLAINGHVFGRDGLTLEAKAGTTELWTVRNVTDYDHPFHLHGFRFQVIDSGGTLARAGEWKDTLNVAAQQQVRLAVHFDDRPGMWMFHCHILDHVDLGMMGMLHLR